MRMLNEIKLGLSRTRNIGASAILRRAFVTDKQSPRLAAMDTDHPSNPAVGGSSETVGTASAANLKAKISDKTDVNNKSNHISNHNGIANHVNDKEAKSSSGSSSSSHAKHNSDHHKNRSKESSGSSSNKHHSSSSKHKEGWSTSSSKDSSNKSKESNSISHSSKHKDGSSSASSKHKEVGSSSSKHDGVSSNSSKHKDASSHSASKHKESSSAPSSTKVKESSSSHHSKDKSSSEHKHSSLDKQKSSSSSLDKHRDKSKVHSKSSSDKHRSKDSKEHSSKSREGITGSSDKKKVESKDFKKSNDELKSASNSPVKVKAESDMPSMKIESLSPTKNSEINKNNSAAPVEVKKVKDEPVSDDDEKPLSMRMKESQSAKPAKRIKEESDDEPLSSRANKVKKQKLEEKKTKKRKHNEEDDEEESKPSKQSKKNDSKSVSKGKKEKEEHEVWKWWEEEKREDGVKWHFLEHKGPVFAPAYEPLPSDIKFYYDGKPMALSSEAEEVATFYAKMLDHEYTTREVFNQNFFRDWRKVMTKQEREIITDLKKCNFTEMSEYFKVKNEERKNRSKEEKLALKKQNEELMKSYGVCTIDGHKEKIGNFKIEPPALFRGRGNHPKQGMLKRRVLPSDVIINCSKDSKIPQPPDGYKWKEVRHDNQVTWLASWNENIQGQTKYIMLNPASKLKGEKDWQKYEIARRLHKTVDKIRAKYHEDWKSKEMKVRQRAVALYFIDKLALRAGNEKEEGETADTVGCCSLRVEHITLHDEKDGKQNVVDFDFLGKDSIRYQNSVSVEKRVFKNLKLFMENKQPEDDLFDRLNTTILNKHLHELMEGLTAKVFRTYNASHTLQQQLNLLTNADDSVPAKILSYNRANRAVAVLCNHQRAVPKTFAKSMENLQGKISAKRKEIKAVKKDIKDVKADYKATKTAKARLMYEKKKKMLTRLEEQLTRLEVQATDKDENKEIALGTSKLNYLDPRITVAWCKKYEVPIEKIYNKTQRDKFRWAIDMATAEFQF